MAVANTCARRVRIPARTTVLKFCPLYLQSFLASSHFLFYVIVCLSLRLLYAVGTVKTKFVFVALWYGRKFPSMQVRKLKRNYKPNIFLSGIIQNHVVVLSAHTVDF